MQILTSVGALDLSNIDAAALYIEASSRDGEALQSLGRDTEARQVCQRALDLADKVLIRRPGNRLALHGQHVNISVLVGVAQDELQFAELQKLVKRQVDVGFELLNLDPGNVATQFNLGLALFNMGDVNVSVGRLGEALPNYQRALEFRRRTKFEGGAFSMIYVNDLSQHADQMAQLGDMAAATKIQQEIPEVQANISEVNGRSSMLWTIADAHAKYGAAAIALQKDDLAAAQREAWDAVREIQSGKAAAGFEQTQADLALMLSAHIAGQGEFRLGNYAGAEKAEQLGVDARHRVGDQAVSDRRNISIMSTWLAMAIARQGRTDEAAKIIVPVVKFDREITARNHGDQWLPVEFAGALYADALADKAQAPALLREAAALIDSVAPSVRAVHDVRQWRERIAAGVPGK